VAIKIVNCNFTWGVEPKDNKTIEEEKTNKSSDKKDKKDKENKANEIKDKDKKDKENDKEPEIDNLKAIINVNETIISSDETLTTSIADDKLTEKRVKNEAGEELVYKTHLKNIDFEVKKGEMIGIIGEVGSGKSTLLQAILNNLILLNKEENNSKIIINGSTSYLSQTPWIQNNTLKENILFFKEYDKETYDKILELCELQQDIEALTGGDQTEIGEKGINLSGGQKARVALARAVHQDTDIYLFDDPLSALDANVGEKIMNNCILDYLKNKTRILVTNALHFLHLMDKIIYVNNGEIKFIGNYEELSKKEFYKELTKKIETVQTEETEKQKTIESKRRQSIDEIFSEVLIDDEKEDAKLKKP